MQPRIAIVGASGAVGQEILKVLKDREFPYQSIRLLGSSRSAGRSYEVEGKTIKVEELNGETSFRDLDIVFCSAGASVSQAFFENITAHGAIMIDNSSAFRMDEDVPLVVPEVNPEDVFKHPRGIIANPNCTTIQLVVALNAIHRINPIRTVHVATYQAASGAGASAMLELEDQTKTVSLGGEPKAEKFAYPLVYNLIPQIDVFMDNGYTKEEMKMYHETKKIMHSEMHVSSCCVRVPVLRAHSEAIWVSLSRPMSIEEARETFSSAPGIVLMDQPTEGKYPMPAELSGRDEVFVGRIRQDLSAPNGLCFWTVSDQIRKGAALNAVQIAERLIMKEPEECPYKHA